MKRGTKVTCRTCGVEFTPTEIFKDMVVCDTACLYFKDIRKKGEKITFVLGGKKKKGVILGKKLKGYVLFYNVITSNRVVLCREVDITSKRKT